MAVIRRIYVEKKTGYDIEAQAMLLDLRDNLSLRDCTGCACSTATMFAVSVRQR